MASGARVLVVDDDEQICKLMERFLEKEGYDVQSVLSGDEALTKIPEYKPHCVLLDHVMPGMNGLETLTEIKKMDEDIVVIMLTGASEQWLYKRAHSLGAYDYITKPVNYDYLKTLLLTKLAFVGDE